MKLKLFFLGFIGIFLLGSCKKQLQLKGVKFTTEEEVKVPFAGIEGMIIKSLSPIILNVDVDKQIREQTNDLASIDNIKEAELNSLSIEKISSSPNSTASLEVFKAMEIWIKAPDFPETMIAKVKNNTNASKITFETINKDIINYLKAPKGEKQLIVKEIKVGDSNFSEFKLKIIPQWKVTVGF